MARRCCCELNECYFGCGFWIPDTYTGDFITTWSITSGSLTISATKNGSTQRTGDSWVFNVPTTNGTYTFSFDGAAAAPRYWTITGPDIPGTVDARVYYTSGDEATGECALNGTLSVRDGSPSGTVLFTLEIASVAEECPACCQSTGGDKIAFPLVDPITSYEYHKFDLLSGGGGTPPNVLKFQDFEHPTDARTSYPVSGQPCTIYVWTRLYAVEWGGTPGTDPDPDDPANWFQTQFIWDPSLNQWRVDPTGVGGTEIPAYIPSGYHFTPAYSGFEMDFDYDEIPGNDIDYMRIDAIGYEDCVFPPASGVPLAMATPASFGLMDAGQMLAKSSLPESGPGTELQGLLSWFGHSTRCKCASRAKIMDQWGPDVCERNIDAIEGWLKEEAKSRGLPLPILHGPVARSLIKKAIKLSRKN